jgi:hypothetical protein
VEGGTSCTNTFSPTNTTNTYQFFGDGRLTVQFVTVLTTFNLTVSVSHPSDPLPLDPNVFPSGTVCVKYPVNSVSHRCDQYDFTGNAGGPHGVPVKNNDYKGLISLTLSYDTFQPVHNPAFGHAPGEITTFTEDILTSYFQAPPCSNCTGDPTMGGKTPGLSSVVALDEPLSENDCFVFVSPTQGQIFTNGQEIEVEFRLFNSSCSGNPLRDKDARLSLSRFENGQIVFVRLGKEEGGKHFHFDHKDGVNEREIGTEGLPPGTYFITVFSDEFSPQTRTVVIQ